MINRKYTATLKVILLGDPMVGKTSIVLRYVRKGFQKNYLATIGVDIYSKTSLIRLEKMGSVSIIWQIWDIAGHKRWEEIRKGAYRGAHGAIFVYDVSREKTYENIINWANEFVKMAGKRPSVLVANKIDLRGKQNCLTYEDGMKLKNELEKLLGYDIPYIESSALEGVNIDEIFETIGKKIIESILRAARKA